MAGSKPDQQVPLGQEEVLSTDNQRSRSFANERPKGYLDFVRAACGQNQKMRVKRSSHILYDPPFSSFAGRCSG
jgi:hypothetical protein